ncbi:solute carrier organic anion transporter family member 4A1-like [Mytilus californianus]|uniref:solute carrier organic anion transporter family member 4A1-like n=1 Tax=Mytilus californianus TaxID=6549 RepID=UPI0022458CFA|nr:solute carrier organic anion transporter family member 4A1-like [Mytilus californianus]
MSQNNNGVKAHDNAAYTASADDVNVIVTKDKLPPKTDTSTVESKWGCCSFKPRCLQGLNRMSLFTLFVCVMCFLEGFAVNGVANAAIPAIERQFKLPSTKSALIPSSQDIGALVVVLFVSFIGGRYNKASWVASGSLIMAVGSFLFMVPHFLEKYVYPESTTQASYNCSISNPPSGDCDVGGEKYLVVFMAAQIVHGFGFTPMFTLGTAYIDENEEHSLAAVYIGLTYALTAIGVAAGFFVGGEFSQNYFVDFDRVDQDSLGFDATDSRWIGAWWLGFIIAIVGFIVIAIPIYGYPKYLPGKEKSTEPESKHEKPSTENIFKQFFVSFIDLIKNPTFMMLTFAGSTNTLIISGVGAFSFKFLMEQYNIQFDIAGFLIGGLILVGSVGMFGGGLLIRMCGLGIKGMLNMCFISSFLSGVLGIAFIAGCPEVKLAGLEVPYPNKINTLAGYTDVCQGSCQCQYEGLSLVCGKDNIVYHSPCHAGCTTQSGQMTYHNCSCVAASLNIPTDHANAMVSAGRCEDGCDKLYIVAPLMFISMICVLTSVTPNSMAVMRVVKDEQRPFALGVQWVFIRLLGTIPGPFLVGWAIDNACLIFLEGSCGNQGNCLLYSHDSMALGVMVWWLVVSLVSAMFYLLAIFFQCCRSEKGSFDLTIK